MARGRIPYSFLEQKILDNIPTDGSRISTIDLVNKCYVYSDVPRNARQSILKSTKNLIEKSDENEEDWEIFRSRQKGTQPIYFWREKRK